MSDKYYFVVHETRYIDDKEAWSGSPRSVMNTVTTKHPMIWVALKENRINSDGLMARIIIHFWAEVDKGTVDKAYSLRTI